MERAGRVGEGAGDLLSGGAATSRPPGPTDAGGAPSRAQRAARRRRTAILATLLLALGALASAHALHRLRTANDRSTEEALAGIRESVVRQGALLEVELSAGKNFARYLAGLEPVRRLLEAESPDAFLQASRDVASFLHRFPSLSSAVVLDAEGNERLRAERTGGGVAWAPRLLLRRGADPARAQEGLLLAPEQVAVSSIEFDLHRVDVAERDRVVLRYVARAGSRAVLVLSLYAAPLFDGLRRVEPFPGVEQMLVDSAGEYLVHPDRSLEIGPAQRRGRSFARDFPQAFDRLVSAGQAAAEEGGNRFVAAATGIRTDDAARPWTLVARAPATALRWSSPSRRAEAVRVGATLLATLATLAVVGAILWRLLAEQGRLAEEREAEKRIAEAERLASVGRLTAGVAHEINNPLAAIGNYLSLLDREGSDPERRHEHLSMVRHGFDRIRTLVRDLLSFARPRLPRRETVDLREILGRVERLCAHDAGFRGIRWESDLGNGLPATAGDPFALEQVFLNLALNARDAMTERGTLRVSIRKVAPEAVEVLFDDTGPGVPEAIRSRIFEPFFSTRGGTGLGLAVSASIVRAHGGTLRAEPAPGGGARFVIALPLAAGNPSPRPS